MRDADDYIIINISESLNATHIGWRVLKVRAANDSIKIHLRRRLAQVSAHRMNEDAALIT